MRFTTEDLMLDHTSNVPANTGDLVKLFVRWFKPELPPGRSRRPVLMVHGRSSPGLVSFDLRTGNPGPSYSWARELAADGFDVFVMDLQGMGRSTRPEPMNEQCNINPDRSASCVPTPVRRRTRSS